MALWQTIAAAVLGNAAILAVLGWLAKSLVEKVLLRDSKRFEIELKAKADSTMEHLRSDLHIRSIEHQVRFSRLHEKRAEVIAELNGLIVEALWEAESFLSPMEWAGEPNKREKHRAAMMKLVEVYRYFDKQRIYLPESLCNDVQGLIEHVRSQVTRFGVYVDLDERTFRDRTHEEKLEAWTKGWDVIKDEVPPVRRRLEDEFRKLLGQPAA